jgi:hypothetical protein
MPHLHTYRCYLLDAQSHIASAEVIECSDDAAAKSRAREILAEKPRFRGVEVWDRARRVHIYLSGEGAVSEWVGAS